ncbi:MAG: nucleotidyltransferase domain-containing protein [Lachnospiraceae bacterium]|nr:nucleotidyltransferase domain-containing protein [Lachnospiraceae bacterium]
MEKADILYIIERLKKDEQLECYRLGLAGSYARGTNDVASDIDIVVDSDGMPVADMECIKKHFRGVEVDILCLGLLRKEDEKLDDFLKEMGLPSNRNSLYKNVLCEVIWCG